MITIWLISRDHPIILKWIIGSARIIGKPVDAIVYTNGQINGNIKVFHTDKYWSSDVKANNYILDLTPLNLQDSVSSSMLKYVNIHFDPDWIGRPAGSGKDDYDIIAGHLFQSETGGHSSPWQDDMKGFDFDPQLLFNGQEIKFMMPPSNDLKIDSIRIVLH